MLPRYFLPTSPATPLPELRQPLLTYVVDVLRLPWGASEAVVVTDRTGALHLVTEAVPECLPDALRSALSHHELSRARPTRRVDAASLYLLLLERVEQPLNTPGANDPVHLSGRLYGPYGAAAPPECVDGTLTVTRGDVLAGFCDSAADALMVPVLDGRAGRCLHLLLPGDSPEATRAGEGVVLAYPLPPAELDPTDSTNEALCAGILADLLAGLQADLRAAGEGGPFARQALPVASRADIERDLELEGWEIHGDTAVRLDARLKKGLGGLLTSVLGVPEGMTRPLPPQGDVDTFLRIARDALAALPGWPSERARALRAAPVVAPHIPARTSASGPTPPVAPGPRAAAPRHTAPPFAAPPAAPPPAAPARPDWQSDFGRPVRRTTELRPKNPANRPDWMDDFE